MTPIILSAFLLAPGGDPAKSEPKAVPATRTEFKNALEDYKRAKPRLPMPPADADNPSRVNNGWFRSYYLSHLSTGGPGSGSGGGRGVGGGARESDPAMTLDNTFKVKLFWVTSRANNCFY